MPNKSAGLTGRALAVYSKDMKVELRSKYAFNAILMFGITTLAVVSFTLGQSGLSASLLAALFWIIMFFAAMAGLAQVFVREEETGTVLALRLAADPTAVYLGKLFFNLSLMILIAFVITPVFFIFTDAPVDNILLFVLVLILGIVGLCAATTIVAAIISKAGIKGALFAVLSFPILFVLLLLLVSASTRVLEEATLGGIALELQGLVAYSGVMITASLMLFKYVWQE
ncbi:MAG: heme exporter protein CcmB [candidate division Zixibacteria bacterium]|nr:heme exporter protein CcmB [candidate division Zixibacteria bacterium]